MAFQWSMGSPDSTQRSSRSSIFGVAVRLGALRRPSQVESDIVWVSNKKGQGGENPGRGQLTDNPQHQGKSGPVSPLPGGGSPAQRGAQRAALRVRHLGSRGALPGGRLPPGWTEPIPSLILLVRPYGGGRWIERR